MSSTKRCVMSDARGKYSAEWRQQVHAEAQRALKRVRERDEFWRRRRDEAKARIEEAKS